MDTSSAPALPRNGRVLHGYEQRGYQRVRETAIGVVLRHPNGGVVTVLASGETRSGDKAGPGAHTPDEWWGEPTYTVPR
ncbi:MAG TPA: hypothetical protein VFD90_16135 [Gaiellales bacterium]|jgi:hypothetical protein|nr:hypothetical protein [Gaiellales bacterium]